MEKNWENVAVPVDVYNNIVEKMRNLQTPESIVAHIQSEMPGTLKGEIEHASELGCSVQEYRELMQADIAFQIAHIDALRPTEQLSPLQERMQQWQTEVNSRIARGESREDINLSKARDCFLATALRQYQETHAQPAQALSRTGTEMSYAPKTYAPG
ncbi:MAG: hypothetical protein KDI13_04265 [Alphaproteobacteria bacterium]|nr:hypothetical protein [Alphaproteobacteria bacterium]